ncbi:uncharacterized protein LOC122078065 [Macadamia integrifolia]|uniref:uncharacterized protein LOC122078065 n=1 Tax=Macadamia integrifolia TaxID=60698 RepID=UPI001C4EA4CE|nr:uncharacterized protein LOC122078065 [Macadamia integrifolia]
MTDKALSMLLDLLGEVLPEPNTLPKNMYETKKIIKDLGLNCNKIDAYPNDYMLFRKGAEKATSCYKCGASRYSSKGKKFSAKTLRHFPLIPRLQRLYILSKTSFNMRWHHEERTKDQRLRHPADSQAWKEFDRLHQLFSEEPRNIRLRLASDGFYPYKYMRSTHSVWPVVVMPYNLPPWMCMKPDYFILTLLIPRPEQPGNDIDHMQSSQDGVLKVLMLVHVTTVRLPHWLKYSKKHCYLGHRRFLPQEHRFRRDKRSFDGLEEHRLQPKQLSGNDILEHLQYVDFPPFGKENNKQSGKKKQRRLKQPELPYNWKKKSIFFDLPYWKDNLVRHNLDVMHIEKNVCDNIVNTLLDQKEKSKDNVNAHLDLRDMKIRLDLQPKVIEGKNKLFIPPASYTMSTTDKDLFCAVLRGVKVPDGLCSNISQCVQERKIIGMKSHDSHIMMQQLLPIAVRNILPKNVSIVLIEVSAFFRELCSKFGKEEDFKRLGESVVLTLCKMERIFPPTFFDVMVHLIVHLAHEASLAGPVQYRWMYPIERFLKRLKDYVRNPSRPVASIAEGYLANECLTYYSRYLEDVETMSTRLPRNAGSTETYDPSSIFSRASRPIGKCEMIRLDIIERDQAHRYVLKNSKGLEEYRE